MDPLPPSSLSTTTRSGKANTITFLCILLRDSFSQKSYFFLSFLPSFFPNFLVLAILIAILLPIIIQSILPRKRKTQEFPKLQVTSGA